MKTIPLSGVPGNGLCAIVDDDDYARISKWSWCLIKGYAARCGYRDGKTFTMRMHRFVMDTPKGMDTDHRNGNKLDNRKGNLRIVTNGQNQWNRRQGQKNNTSGYKGVHWLKATNRYQAYITTHKKRKHLGLFATALEAAEAYNKAAIELHGEFARLNKL